VAVSFLERQLEDPVRRARLRRYALAALLVVLLLEVVLQLMIRGEEPHFAFELPGFGSLYGLVSCVAIIVVSKLVGRVWLMRREDHHDA
jgi:hypothetical protein